MFVTARFWDKFIKEDGTSQRRLLEEIRSVARGQTSTKNRNFLTEGRIGEASKDLGISLRKERLSKSGRIILHKTEDGASHLVDYDWNHTSVEDLEKLSVSVLRKTFGKERFHPELDEWSKSKGSDWRAGVRPRTGGHRDTFEEELGDEWIRFLDKEQQRVCDQLFQEVTEGSASKVNLILGAAGTGKTMVLLDLAWRLIHDAEMGVELQMPPGVREYLAKSDQGYWFQRAKSGPVTLIDDPKDFESMEREISKARAAGKVVVVSIDPTQWTHKRTRSQFWALLQSSAVKRFDLRTAYRQGGAVGQPSLELLSSFYKSASMFADSEKVSNDQSKAKSWEDLCLREAKHVDDKGFFIVHKADSPEELGELLATELREVMSFETYRRWPKLLIGTGVSERLPKGAADPIVNAQARYGLTYKIRSFEEVDKVRGTEFESVILFLSASHFSKINDGPKGLGADDYQRLTQPLTFLTRAENRLVLFILKDNFPYLAFKK